MTGHAWPTLSADRRDVFRADVADARRAIQRLEALTVYASGGIPATHAHDALQSLAAIEAWLSRD